MMNSSLSNKRSINFNSLSANLNPSGVVEKRPDMQQVYIPDKVRVYKPSYIEHYKTITIPVYAGKDTRFQGTVSKPDYDPLGTRIAGYRLDDSAVDNYNSNKPVYIKSKNPGEYTKDHITYSKLDGIKGIDTKKNLNELIQDTHKLAFDSETERRERVISDASRIMRVPMNSKMYG